MKSSAGIKGIILVVIVAALPIVYKRIKGMEIKKG